MKNTIKIQVISKRKFIEKTLISILSVILTYLLISWYFTNHYFFHTTINGVNVSLKSYKAVGILLERYIDYYELQLIESDGSSEVITSKDIGMTYKVGVSFHKINTSQKSLKWIVSLFKEEKYEMDLYDFHEEKLLHKINHLNCINRLMIEPQNVSFRYSNGGYEVIKEIEGNKIIKDKLYEVMKIHLRYGKTRLNLKEMNCYEKPSYTLDSKKTLQTLNLLNRYVTTVVTYKFGDEKVILDGNTINKWVEVDENLDVIINKTLVLYYMKELSKTYDTVGIDRTFKTSTGKNVTIHGGLYGWRINQDKEHKALIEQIESGVTIEKEPIYTQKALSREGNEIGNTYVEINITKQHVWFYKDGKLIVEGPVVTGNPSRGNATVEGVHMLNYKQKEVTLKGVGYEADVTYWMPFYGNIGLHDASWRNTFGGEIYKNRGTHGCVNAPLYLAKTIFEKIEEGIPIIVYKE